jgi:phenylpropionate dioxygenase-like ring-hydroxylating dioxygenase large terminal subunit
MTMPYSREQPRAIPRSYYQDDDIFARELRDVFGPSWLFLGHESEIPAPGDYLTRRMGADPVVVSRDERGDVHVLLNSCTHRGTQVCKAAFGNTATFKCGYHGWTFGNDGTLRGVPGRRALYPPDFDLSRHGLRHARVETLHGLIFATWNASAPPLRDHLGGLAWYADALFDYFPGGLEVYRGAHRVVVKGNWKIHTENFCGDGYHLRVAHRTMFELGVMGDQAAAAATRGWVVSDPNGHSLRAQYLDDPELAQTVFGYPEGLTASAAANRSKDQLAFRAASTVIHGALFPNFLFITTAPFGYGADATGQTAFFQIRVLTPIGPHAHEVTYWTLVPKDAPEDWKRKSYLYSIRQHGAASFFEADDLENFHRIEAGLGGVGAADLEFNYDLGNGVAASAPPPWEGHGTIVAQDFSEANQRNLIRRYLELLNGPIEEVVPHA